MSKNQKGLVIHIENPKDPSSVMVWWNGELLGHIDQLRLSISGKTSRINFAFKVPRGMFRSITKLADRLGHAGIKAAVAAVSQRSLDNARENLH